MKRKDKFSHEGKMLKPRKPRFIKVEYYHVENYHRSRKVYKK